MEGNFGRDTYRSGYAAAPLISSTPVSHNHPLYRPCRIRQDDFCSSTKIAARYSQDKDNQRAVAVKKMLLYALDEDARQLLCEAVATVATGIEEPRSKPANADWAEEEFGGARLGDQRLNQRLVTIARDFGANPQAQIPGACQSRAKTKAAYRFFEHPKTAM